MSTLNTYLAGMKSALRTKKAEVQVLEKQVNEFEQLLKNQAPAKPVAKLATKSKPKVSAKKSKTKS